MDMFTFEQIKELIELVGRNKLNSLEVERSGFKLRITGEAPPPAGRETVVVTAPAAAAPVIAAPAAAPAPEGAPAAAESAAPAGPAPDLHVVVSPIVGTFYAAPSPDAPPYARVGDRIRKGQVVCIVEAMKLMNEIESDVDGVIAEIYPKNAQPIEYGEPLFGVRPD
jgi:acetyl-CoA carboxylase biotin carboxyl carrier protein